MDLLIVADDLTGANDTGAVFAERGFRTAVRRTAAPVDWPAAVDVGVVDTDSRDVSPQTAADRVARVVSGAPDVPVYLKVDSTLRGNLVASVDAAMDATGAVLGVIAPAFPATGRQTVGGYHLVDGTPVAETAVGDEPTTTTRTSHLPTRLADADRPVTAIGLDAVTADRVEAAFTGAADPAGALVVCDAATDEHLARIARAAAAVDGPVLSVGSAGLAAHVRLGPPWTVLGVVGSVAPETFAQLNRLPADAVVQADPERVVTDPDREAERATEAVEERLDAGRPVAVTAARETADVSTTRRAGRNAGFSEEETAAHVESVLADVARSVHETVGLDGLFVTGGAVATATLDALDASGVSLTGQSVATGIPLGHADGGRADGLPLVTKAGAFGGETAIVNCLRFLATYHDR